MSGRAILLAAGLFLACATARAQDAARLERMEAENAALKRELKALYDRVAALEARVKALEAAPHRTAPEADPQARVLDELVSAIRAKDFDRLHAILPDQNESHWRFVFAPTNEVEAYWTDLVASQDKDKATARVVLTDQDGKRAAMRVELIRAGGAWKIARELTTPAPAPHEKPVFDLARAILRYRDLTGEFPPAPNRAMVQALVAKNLFPKTVEARDGEALDHWLRPMVYRRPTGDDDLSGNLYSIGPNGIDEGGEGDDVPFLYRR